MILRDFGATAAIIVALLFVLGFGVFAWFDPGDKTGFYQPEAAPVEAKP